MTNTNRGLAGIFTLNTEGGSESESAELTERVSAWNFRTKGRLGVRDSEYHRVRSLGGEGEWELRVFVGVGGRKRR